jgi:hypothetical protein
MQIEEGKFYKNRVGDKVGPMRLVGARTLQAYPWADNCHRLYTNKGMYGVLESSSKDLIEEWEEPAALPPATEADGGWGDWHEGVGPGVPIATLDYREERINGVWRWQSRPRKPVVKTLERVIGTPTKSYRVSFNEIDGVIDCSSVKMEPL